MMSVSNVVRRTSYVKRQATGDFPRGGSQGWFFVLVVAMGAHLLATSQAQSLSVGLFASPGYLTPTLEGSLEPGGR